MTEEIGESPFQPGDLVILDTREMLSATQARWAEPVPVVRCTWSRRWRDNGWVYNWCVVVQHPALRGPTRFRPERLRLAHQRLSRSFREALPLTFPRGRHAMREVIERMWASPHRRLHRLSGGWWVPKERMTRHGWSADANTLRRLVKAGWIAKVTTTEVCFTDAAYLTLLGMGWPKRSR